MQHSSKFLDLVREVKSKVTETDVPTVWKRFEAGEELLIIDVREESEYSRAHVRGAHHLGKGIIERDIERMVPNQDQEIVLYCGGGYRSAIAAENLQRMGYTKVISMDGGFKAWAEAGLPINIP